jgi:ERAP1-like C-terminal domain
LPPDLASAVLGVVAASGGDAEYEAFLECYRHPATPQEEIRYLMALAGFRRPELAARSFALLDTDVRTQNAPFLVQLLLANRVTGAGNWARLTERWDETLARLPANIVPRMLDGVRSLCRDRAVADSVAQFLAQHPLPSGQRTVEQIVERLFVNVALAARMADEAGPALRAGVQRLAE